MRQAFITTLEKLAAKDRRIYLLNGDLGFSVLENFNQKFPTRSLNMGVSEANMVGAAAGLAIEGNIVFIYSIVPFVTMRVFEQVRDDVAMQKANVKIVGVGSGFTYGQLGPTHHSIEDIALMRVLPNMTVFSPGDPYETAFVTEAAAYIEGPAYIRIGKKGEAAVHVKKEKLTVGKGVLLREGKDLTLLATGTMLPAAMIAADILAGHYLQSRVISLHTLKPIDKAMVLRAARETKSIFTLEEHLVAGGLGSIVAELLLEKNVIPSRFYRFGVRNTFTYVSGSQAYLKKLHGLDPSQIAAKILQILKKT